MDQPVVLIVHEDAAVRALLGRMLPSFGYTIRAVTSGEEGIDQVASGDVGVVLLDLTCRAMSGADTLRALRAMSPAPEVVVTSARGTVTAAAEVARHGAFDFVPQPFDFADLSQILRTAHEQAARRRQTLHLEAALKAPRPLPGDRRAQLRNQASARSGQQGSPDALPVLVQGESGTGKELVARRSMRTARGRPPL